MTEPTPAAVTTPCSFDYYHHDYSRRGLLALRRRHPRARSRSRSRNPNSGPCVTGHMPKFVHVSFRSISPGPAVRRAFQLTFTSHVSPKQSRNFRPRYFTSHPYHALGHRPTVCTFPHPLRLIHLRLRRPQALHITPLLRCRLPKLPSLHDRRLRLAPVSHRILACIMAQRGANSKHGPLTQCEHGNTATHSEAAFQMCSCAACGADLHCRYPAMRPSFRCRAAMRCRCRHPLGRITSRRAPLLLRSPGAGPGLHRRLLLW